MEVTFRKLEVQSTKDTELIDITNRVEDLVKESGVVEGMVFVLTLHTSAGVLVTEGLPDLERDILTHMAGMAPADGSYYHNRFLEIDGRLGFNAPAHLKSVLGGMSTFFPVAEGKLVKGSRQRIYFAEYDGPLNREVCIQVIGNREPR